ncbi:F-box only protein 41 isoform X2 [Electrophorus electricus]|uniref:F-box only protein 41 isoform X2 n=2 Tax=Electrophorus electricus TaxID=8005 RepID=UPI0015D01036|nr:F-box only protein 41 isoform X2 [Electrophorus electricus]
MTTSELSVHCPDCGQACGFGDLQTCSHTCQRICLTTRRNSEGALTTFPTQQQCSPQGNNEMNHPLYLELLDRLSLASSTTIPLSQLLVRGRASPPLSPSLSPMVTVAVSSGPGGAEAASGRGLARPSAPWPGRPEVEARLQRLALEVQERLAVRLEALREEVKWRSAEVSKVRMEGERMEGERQQAEERAAQLAQQVEVSVEMLASLRQELMEREEQLDLKHQEVCELDRFVRETAFREAGAKLRLQGFIEDLLERAERAERRLQDLHACSQAPTRAAMPHTAVHQRSYSVSGMSKRCYPRCDAWGSAITRGSAGRRLWTLSLGSWGCQVDREGVQTPPDTQCYHMLCGGPEGPERERAPPSPCWTPHTQPGPEDDSDSWSIYTMESQEDLQQHCRMYSKTEHAFHSLTCRHDNRPDESMMCSEQMRMRAWLFCVFTYLDTRSLLIAAQVCRDWWSVARHPAVWTRVTLENTRISSRFLVTLSHWCSQTQFLVLQNLKPRSRHRKETKEEYLKSTRGCLEVGLEAVLKSAGRSLTSLAISHCPNILTDRTLWLVSCHSRALHALTYRSSSDPVGQEVLWALAAGCRDITGLFVAPLQPCQQPSRFSNRCLQTIGRCWPNLQQVGVGGAGCRIQGLASLVRNCPGLCVLKLDHMSEMSQEGATELCRDGLQQLHTLVFTSTPVTARALLHFTSVCVKLKSVVVQTGIADYFQDSETEEAKRMFDEIVDSLQALQKRPGLSDVLQLRVDRP